MFKVLQSDGDTYINNRVIGGVAQVGSNVGAAGSLDLFKLYGYTSTRSGSVQLPNTELSRLLVHFDLSPLRELVALGKVDASNPTFSCHVLLRDVYGGQPTPSRFNIVVYPLSASFDEGLGRDVVTYSDSMACNWLTSSLASGSWLLAGCGLGGSAQQACDYITASALINSGAPLASTQYFPLGTEDLQVDVTTLVSATLAGLLPDAGFRLSFDQPIETNTQTYFVKRFASRTAYADAKHPQLIVRFDDSIQDDTNNLTFDSPGTLVIYNSALNQPANILSGSTPITGSNSLNLRLETAVSGGHQSLLFPASQLRLGGNPQIGIYSASISLSSTDTRLTASLQSSGSVTFTPIWQSLDGSVAYLTGSMITVGLAQRGSRFPAPRTFNVTVQGLPADVPGTATVKVRVNIFDYTQPSLTSGVRVPVELPGITVRDVHYQVRDTQNGLIVVPFDTTTNSTRLSNDSAGMYFSLDASNLVVGRSYVVDVLILTAGERQQYPSASQVFRVS